MRVSVCRRTVDLVAGDALCLACGVDLLRAQHAPPDDLCTRAASLAHQIVCLVELPFRVRLPADARRSQTNSRPYVADFH